MNKWHKITAYTLLTVLLITGCFNNDNMAEDVEHGETKDSTTNKDSTNREVFEEAPTSFNNQASQGLITRNTKNITRLMSDDPVETSILASQTIWPATHQENQPGAVILAPVENWQLAMASANLIHHPNNGPILFSQKGQLTQQVVNEIKRLNPLGNVNGTQIWIMGEYSESMKSQLAEFKVEHIAETQPSTFAAQVDGCTGLDLFSLLIL